MKKIILSVVLFISILFINDIFAISEENEQCVDRMTGYIIMDRSNLENPNIINNESLNNEILTFCLQINAEHPYSNVYNKSSRDSVEMYVSILLSTKDIFNQSLNFPDDKNKLKLLFSEEKNKLQFIEFEKIKYERLINYKDNLTSNLTKDKTQIFDLRQAEIIDNQTQKYIIWRNQLLESLDKNFICSKNNYNGNFSNDCVCFDGYEYKKNINKCEKKVVCLENSTLGDDNKCYCNSGYSMEMSKKSNSKCVKITCPKNSEIQNDNKCHCKAGFNLRDNKCVQLCSEKANGVCENNVSNDKVLIQNTKNTKFQKQYNYFCKTVEMKNKPLCKNLYKKINNVK